MAKYSQYIAQHPVEERRYGPEFRFIGEEDFKSNFTMNIIRVTEPVLMEPYAHSHDFDIYLIFLGFNPDAMGDLGAEIEMSFGEEMEKFLITVPTTVYIPKGLIHCPLHFRKIDKPVLFLHATLAPNYIRPGVYLENPGNK
jgi:hypothetical protein